MTKVLIIGGDKSAGKSALLIASMKEKYGEDVVLVTPEEARELRPEDFANMIPMKITTNPIFDMPIINLQHKDGKQRRRERRAKDRKSKKHR